MTWKTIGRFHIAARLSASWKAPVSTAPSPNWHSTAFGWPVWSSARAAPAAIGRWAADDAPAAEEAALDVEQVHRAAAAVGDAGDLAEQLGHDRGGRAADRERGAVVAVGREQAVALLQRVDGADDRGLLADGQVAVAADPRARVLLLGALLEAADQHHLAKQPVSGVGVQLEGRDQIVRAAHAGTLSSTSGRLLIDGHCSHHSEPGRGEAGAMLIRFLVEPRAPAVKRGDPLYELDTDKVTQEVEAEADGMLLQVVGTEGEEYPGGRDDRVDRRARRAGLTPAVSRPLSTRVPLDFKRS